MKLTPKIANATLAVLAVLSAFLIAEAGLRLTGYRYLLHHAYGFPKGYFIPDPELGTDLAVNFPPQPHEFLGENYTIFTNSLGCFDKERQVGGAYALVLGDSWAWGYAPLPDKWTSILEGQTGWPILKCGVPGSGTYEQLQRARRLIARIGHAPKLILLMYNAVTDVNDDYLLPVTRAINGCRVETLDYLDWETGVVHRLSEAEITAKYQHVDCDFAVERTPWGRFRRFVLRSLTGEMFKELVWPSWKQAIRKVNHDDEKIRSKYGKTIFRQYDPGRPWMAQALNANKEHLRAIIRLAQAQRAKLVLIDKDGDLQSPLMADILQELQQTPSVYYYDLSRDMKASEVRGYEKYYWQFDPHWNIEGNAQVAKRLQAFLQSAGLAGPLAELP